MKCSKSVFLVEDDEDDQMFFAECMAEIANANIYGIANNGKEALDKLEKDRELPDIIFMDINMPVMNGLVCLTEIINHPRLKHIPVVILSTDTGNAALASKMGAKAFIKKPSDCVILRTKLDQLIHLDFASNASFASGTFQVARYA